MGNIIIKLKAAVVKAIAAFKSKPGNRTDTNVSVSEPAKIKKRSSQNRQ